MLDGDAARVYVGAGWEVNKPPRLPRQQKVCGGKGGSGVFTTFVGLRNLRQYMRALAWPEWSGCFATTTHSRLFVKLTLRAWPHPHPLGPL